MSNQCKRPAVVAIKHSGQGYCRLHARELDHSMRGDSIAVKRRRNGSVMRCCVRELTYAQHWRQLKVRTHNVLRMLKALPHLPPGTTDGWTDALARQARMAARHANALLSGPSSWLNVNGHVVPAFYENSTDEGHAIVVRDKDASCTDRECQAPLREARLWSDPETDSLFAECQGCEAKYALMEVPVVKYFQERDNHAS